jgi:hypothetical protein
MIKRKKTKGQTSYPFLFVSLGLIGGNIICSTLAINSNGPDG